jgi:uncharacterized membrane protein YfcA
MNIGEILKIGSVLLLGGVIQSSTGFGFGLFAIPLLLFMKISLPETVIIVILSSAIQKVAATTHLRKFIKWKELYPMMAVGFFSLPLGIYLMFRVSNLDHSSVKQIIGVCIFLLLLLRLKGIIKSTGKDTSSWGLVAAFFSGLLNGFANIGGPPMVIWILTKNWNNERMRGTLLAFSLVFVPAQIVIMLVIFGSPVSRGLLMGVVLSPLVLFGTWAGLKIGAKFSEKKLKSIMQALLFCIAVSSILFPLL